MSRTVDNHGIGALYATFSIHKTGEAYDLDESHVGDAVALSGSNEIGHGSDGAQLLGRLEYVADGLATVQIQGVVRFALSGGKTAPGVGHGVVVDGAGGVYQAPAVAGGAGDPAGGNIARGTTLAVIGSSMCDVLL
ncbi:MAG: hypothetical protein JXR73_04100 [Candidatus Omnitrophica bacterium]|nr:hypothetical protein [Candidatus Omnitrophota bacterium]